MEDATSSYNWSRNGFIAYADHSDNEHNLSVSHLESLDKGKTWSLSKKKSLVVRLNSTSPINEISRLEWSPSGMDLSVIDEYGNISILTSGVHKVTTATSNSPVFVPTSFEEIETMHQDYISSPQSGSSFKILDFKWLNIDKPVIANSPAIRQQDGKYSFGVHQYKSYGCVHPVSNKSGFFIIRQNGSLEFFYQTLNAAKVEYQKTSIKLNNSSGAASGTNNSHHSHNANNSKEKQMGTWLSHANFGFYRDGPVCVTTFSPIDSYIRVYKVTVNWGYNQQMNKLEPSLVVETIINEQMHKFDADYNALSIDKIEVLSANFSAELNVDIIINFKNSDDENVLLSKYHLNNKFTNVRKDSLEPVESFYTLDLVGEIEMPYKVNNITSQNFGFYIMLTIEKDGVDELQIRSRKNFKLYSAANTNAISTLVDFGFKFPSLPIVSNTKNYICLSPCSASYVSISSAKGSELQFHYGVKSEASGKFQNEQEMKQISVGLAHLFSSSCYLNSTGDELLPVIQQILLNNPEHSEKFLDILLKECHSSLNFSLDCPKDQIDKIIVSPPIQKLIWLQYSLGQYSADSTKTAIGKSILNLRLTAFSVMLTLRTIFHQQQKINKRGTVENVSDSIMRSDTVLSTLGTVNWFIDFLIFAVQELMHLHDNSEHKTIIVPLLLAKIPRNLIIYAIAGIKRVESFLIKIEEHNNNIFKQSGAAAQVAPQVHFIKDVLTKSLDKLKRLKDHNINLDKLEEFLGSVENLLQLPDTFTKEQKIENEQELIIQNQIPSYFKDQNIVGKLLDLFQSTYAIPNEARMFDLYQANTQSLELTIKKNQIPKRVYSVNKSKKRPFTINQSKLIDNVTKVQLIVTPEVLNNLKKCNRCCRITATNPTNQASTSSDIVLGPGYSYGDEHHIPGIINGIHAGSWMAAFQRNCICGGLWCPLEKNYVLV
ncbi:hypothetical protein WICPIJ_008006 [Wickerhamomyces pijperi]|uniref:Mediator of RNA polymerase II transcription subunit 16 n=1 Tax=Wickerhamomyces pijperi TaxID=599730 RepID=A0A9P8PYT8_WICPI|nr:hypothetical protein WICPIJ_008006 [Wickerhamomyces pijperi]